jgi:methionyl-tRNA formyltransferase
MDRLKIIFAGSGAFGVPSLTRLRDRGADLIRVYTQPSKPAGRGNRLTPTPVGQFAAEHDLRCVETPDINVEPLPSADLMVVIAFGQKLSPAVVEHARLGAINLHASRLPRYRGAAPINWAVINGDPTTGNSVIRLAQRMDAGAVLGMSELPIEPLATAGEIHDRLALDGAELLESTISQLVSGRVVPIEQDHTQATRAPKLGRESAIVDFCRPASQIANQIRGMYPWPGCRFRMIDRDGNEQLRLTLIRCKPVFGTKPANGIGSFDAGARVVCGEGLLEIVELQSDGKRAMHFEAFCNGHRVVEGMRLESIK